MDAGAVIDPQLRVHGDHRAAGGRRIGDARHPQRPPNATVLAIAEHAAGLIGSHRPARPHTSQSHIHDGH